MNTIPIYVPSSLQVTDEQFRQIVAANPDLRLEKKATGELIIMPPTGGNTGRKNLSLSGQLYIWNQQKKLGVAFDSSTAFVLPNSAILSPDGAWISQQRWDSLTQEEKDDFPPICPDFVIELRSKSDRIKDLREKMQEYIENGIKLGWLIDPKTRQVEIYRPNQAVEILTYPTQLSGEDILPEFILELNSIFD